MRIMTFELYFWFRASIDEKELAMGYWLLGAIVVIAPFVVAVVDAIGEDHRQRRIF